MCLKSVHSSHVYPRRANLVPGLMDLLKRVFLHAPCWRKRAWNDRHERYWVANHWCSMVPGCRRLPCSIDRRRRVFHLDGVRDGDKLFPTQFPPVGHEVNPLNESTIVIKKLRRESGFSGEGHEGVCPFHQDWFFGVRSYLLHSLMIFWNEWKYLHWKLRNIWLSNSTDRARKRGNKSDRHTIRCATQYGLRPGRPNRKPVFHP